MPTTRADLAISIVQKSRPDADHVLEQRLEHIEAQSAACYAEIESLTFLFGELANSLNEGIGIPEEIEDMDSTVFHLREAVKKAGVG